MSRKQTVAASVSVAQLSAPFLTAKLLRERADRLALNRGQLHLRYEIGKHDRELEVLDWSNEFGKSMKRWSKRTPSVLVAGHPSWPLRRIKAPD
jgi:hypothetical protein